MELSKDRNIHFVGIGGSGMLGLARMLCADGYKISGSDSTPSAELNALEKEGVQLHFHHNPANIPADTQAVVHTVAVKNDNPEIEAASIRGIPVIKYAEMVGKVMHDKIGIAVSGTHGKTTTTSMITFALKEMGENPSFIIGGNVPQLGGNSGVGTNGFFVVEACEYDRSFHNYAPKFAIINNIEEDHLDYYSNLEEIVESFRIFASKIPSDGILLYSKSSTNISKFINSLQCRKISYAVNQEADYTAFDVEFEGRESFFNIKSPDNTVYQCTLSLTGTHNVINALAAFALLHSAGFSGERIAHALKFFRGVKRRMEFVYEDSTTAIINDYAHHPTEIQTVLKSLRKAFGSRRIITVFQPHQHSRTRFLMKDFSKSFVNSDITILPDIFFVRDSEEVKKSIHSRDLAREINNNGGNALYIPTFEEIENYIFNMMKPGDVIITMGAGDIYQVSYSLKKQMLSCEIPLVAVAML